MPCLADERSLQALDRVDARPIYVPFLDLFCALSISD
jgi:hypothetical protein